MKRLNLRHSNLELVKGASAALLCAAMLPACSNAKLIPEVVDTPPKSVSLKVQNYCPDLGYTFSDVFAHNASAELVGETIEKDTDRDGLPDIFENDLLNQQRYNINPFKADTNGNGYNDLFLVRINADVSRQSSLRSCTGQTQDTDLDNINDCTEYLLKTSFQNYDSDGDHIPDELELRYGLNPSDPSDANQDPDGDGFTNLQEVMMGTNPFVTNTQKMMDRAISYSVNPQSLSGANNCQDIVVSNLPIVNVDNGNQLRIYVAEVNAQGQRQLRTAIVIVLAEVQDKSTVVINGATEFSVGKQNLIWWLK